MLVAFNIVVLCALFVLLIVEEIRFRRFSALVSEKREGLLSLAHQLRSPLAALRKYQSFLQSNEFGKLSFAQQEALNKIDGAFGESVVLVERILARSRIDDGRLSTEEAVVDFVDSANAAVQAVTPAADARKHQIFSSVPKKQILVKMDPLLLHGILDELLMNAIQYMPAGGTVRVTLAQTQSSVLLSVADKGIGIPDSEKKLIFQKFFRGQKARILASGNGLGLAFAKQFAQQGRGTISFVSQEGKGSTFTLSLPRSARKS